MLDVVYRTRNLVRLILSSGKLKDEQLDRKRNMMELNLKSIINYSGIWVGKDEKTPDDNLAVLNYG